MANSKDEQQTQLPTHGAAVLPSVKVDSYNLEIEDEDGFLGDKANRDAFWDILDKWRKPLRSWRGSAWRQTKRGDRQEEARRLLADGEPEAAGIVQSAIEEFAQQLTLVIRRFRSRSWRDTECLVIGGGFRASRIGELAVGRSRPSAEGRRYQYRSGAYPQRSRRGRPDRRRASAAGLDAARATTASSPSTSAAPTSAPASSSSI